MRHAILAAAVLAVSALPAIAQPFAARAKIGVDRNAWVDARLALGPADSLDLTPLRSTAVLRATPGTFTIERRDGVRRGSGAIAGALIGGAIGVAIPLMDRDLRESGWGGLIAIPLGASFAGAGALLGAIVAPNRWQPYTTARPGCAAYRLAPGSSVRLRGADGQVVTGVVRVHTSERIGIGAAYQQDTTWLPTGGTRVSVTAGRDRKRAALIWGGTTAVLSALAVSGDPTLEPGDGPAIVVSNAVLFGLVGAAVGSRRAQWLQLPAC